MNPLTEDFAKPVSIINFPGTDDDRPDHGGHQYLLPASGSHVRESRAGEVWTCGGRCRGRPPLLTHFLSRFRR